MIFTFLACVPSAARASGLRVVPGTTTQTFAEPADWIGVAAVAFDTTNNVYLIVYETYTNEVKGQFVGTDGMLQGGQFHIATGSLPELAFAPGQNMFAVVFTDGSTRKALLVRYQASGGVALVTPAPVAVTPLVYTPNMISRTAWVPSRSQFIVSWFDVTGTGSGSFLRTMSPAGVLGPVVTLANTPGDTRHETPWVACGATECAAVGKMYNDVTKNYGTWVRWLDFDGNPTSSVVYLDSGNQTEDLQFVTYNSTQNFYLVNWNRAGGFPDSLTLTPGATSGSKSTYPTLGGAWPAYNGGSNTFVLGVTGWNYDVFAHELSSRANPIGGNIPVADVQVLNSYVISAVDAARGRTLMVYKGGLTFDQGLYSLRLRLVQTDAGDTGSGGVGNLQLAAGNSTQMIQEPVDWIGSADLAFDTTNNAYLIAYETYKNEVKGQFVGTDGVLQGGQFHIAAGSYPELAYAPGQNMFAVVYTNGNARMAVMVRHQASGGVELLTPTPILVTPLTYTPNMISRTAWVASRNQFIVSWFDVTGAGSGSFLRTMSPTGVLGPVVTLAYTPGDTRYETPWVTCGTTECAAVGKMYNDVTKSFGTWVRWLDFDGNPTSSVVYLETSNQVYALQYVTYSPTRNFYFVNWTRAGGFPDSMTLAPGATGGTKTTYATLGGATPVHNRGTDSFVLGVAGWNYDIFAHELDSQAYPVGGNIPVSDVAVLNSYVLVAADAALGRTLVVYKGGTTFSEGVYSLRMRLLQGGLGQPGSSYPLSITKTGTGSGTVTSDSGGINCGTTCGATYASGTVVKLTATAAGGSVFAGWSGTGCTGGSVTISASATCSATFNLITQSSYTLAVSKAGAGAGTVTSSPGAINCGATCSAVYASGTQVALTATPANGSLFGGWSGTGCAGGSVAVNANITCAAAFSLIETSTGALKPVGTGSQIIGENTGIDAFDVAFDSTMLQYLVVWSTWTQEVKGVLLNSAGQAAGSAFVIANGMGPRVAYSSASGTYLVTYTSGATRMARPVSPVAGGTATLGTPSTLGNLNWVSANANAGSSADVPSLNTFLTTWWDGASHIMIRSIGASGPVAAASTLITDASIPELPEIACGPSACLVVGRTWSDAIWARWVDLAGAASTARFDIESGGSSTRGMARVAYNSTQATWVVDWVRDNIPQTTTVASGAVTAGTIQPVVPNVAGSQLDLAFNAGLDAFGIVAQGASSDIWAQGLDGAGTPFNGAIVTASTVPTTDGAPALTANPSAGQFLVVYRPTITTLRVQLLGEVTSAGLAPFGAFDTPADGATGLQGSFAVTGWALDETGIARVEIWRDLVSGEPSSHAYTTDPSHPAYGKVFIANPLFVAGSRPDVEIAYSNYPNASRAGWGYLLLSWGLPGQLGSTVPITYKLYAYGYDVNGRNTLLGSKTLTVDNAHATKPFGAIDTPEYGATVSGAFFGFGWALTPNGASSCSVANGSVLMGIDSGPSVPVAYLGARSDIAAAFPGFSDSSHAGGSVWIDTTTLSNGVHQIGWLVTDSCGRQDGIGSRFFTVSNGVGDAPAALKAPVPAARRSAPAAAAVSAEPLSVRASGGDWQAVVPSGNGPDVIEVRQGGAIELRLPSAGVGYAGYQDIRGERRHLPLGSSLDAEAGVFSWQPGPGFLGNFDLVFLVQDREVSRVRVVVKPAIQDRLEAPDAAGAAVVGNRPPGSARTRPPKGPIKRN